MLQQPRLIQLFLVGAILLGLLIGMYLVASRRHSKSYPAGVVVKHTVETRPDDVLKYWTPERMRKAKPAAMPQVTGRGQGKQHTRRPPDTSGSNHS